MKQNILIIFGTRPEAIKFAPVIRELKKLKQYNTIVCSTGQHREMLKQVLDIFKLKVDVDLDLMKPNQDLSDITATAILKLREVFTDQKPSLVLVQGDTTTAFIAALAGYYAKVKVGHVEAGLRSYNIYSPYPEEANRRFISTVCNFHFAPTRDSQMNLLREGVPQKDVFVTGNTVVDALATIADELKKAKLKKALAAAFSAMIGNSFIQKKYILITMHRREKFGEEFRKTLIALRDLAAMHPEYNFIYPVHLNPNVQVPVNEILKGISNFHLIPPQDYLSFIYLMSNCHFILSDSGGVQEECFVFRKPIIVMRDVTERNEAIKAGYAFLVGSSPVKIKKKFKEINGNLAKGYNYFRSRNPFGDGKASQRIASVILKKLS
ncbi:MAG: UDP-N-acetylglucosamine 2-epimerase (non-hydrolyzing) [Ignavibacteriales bacterium]|nr:UDP-N-acetylglucosamine 2-epimerase (non-hydrolyzing) [Ignavibacteriales bacterium]